MLVNLCEYLNNVGEKELAVKVVDVFLRTAESIEQLDQIAQCLNTLNYPDKAIPIVERIIQSTKDRNVALSAKYNLAKLYNSTNYPEKAVDLYRQLKAVFPNDIDVELDTSYSYFLNNQKEKAEEILRSFEKNQFLSEEQNARISFNLAVFDLSKGEFQQGLRRFIFNLKDFRKRAPRLDSDRYWTGEFNIVHPLIVVAEGGIGDEFINVRFIKDLQQHGLECYWLTSNKDVEQIIKSNGYPVISSENLPDDYSWVYSMELPIHLDKTAEQLWGGPYLKQSDVIHPQVDCTKPLNIGVRWQGNVMYEQDLHRTVDLKDIISGIDGIDCDIYSLQRDDGMEQLKSFPQVKDMSSYMTTFQDTLDIISGLDIVITSCTSVAHASAAMGKPTIIMVPISSYYTWCHPTEKSPWYGNNLYILRQEKPRSWIEPSRKLKNIIESIL